ncbi:MAG TPA: ATPase [Actinomycetota bacterium]|jgi:cell division septum initiation protein DivIVA|nr:ATPase [Actinomycetota bacterium]
MDIASRIRQLEELIHEAKSMPLSASVLINRDEVLELVDGMKKTLPDEVRQARWVVKDREELLAKARRDAEGVIEEASRERDRLVAEQEVVSEAVREADRILTEARGQARQMNLESEDYADAKLAAFEATVSQFRDQLIEAFTDLTERLSRALDVVQRGRERLHGGTIAEEHLGVEELIEEVEEEEE